MGHINVNFKSKTAFKTPFDALSKLAEQVKIHIIYNKNENVRV